MSTDEFDDDGVVRRPKKPVRLRQDGQPDRRQPPKRHQFKPGQSGNPKGRKPGSKNRPKAEPSIDELLAIERVMPNGEVRTLAEIMHLRQIKAAAEGSTPAYVAVQAAVARARIAGGPPESEAETQARRRLTQKLMDHLNWFAKLKKAGLLNESSKDLAAWIYEEHQRRGAAGLSPSAPNRGGGKTE